MPSVQYLNPIFKAIPLPCLLMQANAPHFTIVNATEAYLKVTNTTEANLLGKNVFEVFPDDPNNAAADGVATVTKSYLEVISSCKSNSLAVQKYDIPIGNSGEFEIRYWSIENTPVLNAEGCVEFIISSVNDITEKVLLENKHAELEKQLALKKEALEKIESSTEVGTWEMNLETGEFLWSPEFFKICGYKPNAFTPSIAKALEIIHPDDREKVTIAYKNTVVKGLPYRIEHKIVRPNGEIITVQSTGLLKKGTNNKPSSFTGLFQNITSSQQMEDMLRQTVNTLKERNEFAESIIQNLPIGIAVNKITDGKATTLNKRFSEIYGWPEEDLNDITTFFEKVYPEETYRKDIIERVMADINSGDPSKMNWNNIIVTTKTGEKRIINAKNIPLFDQNLMISTVVDVTQSTKLLAEINSTKKNQDALINGTTDLIWSVDKSFKIITANNAYQEKLGISSKNIVADLKKEQADFITKLKTHYQNALNGKSFSVKEQIINPNTKTVEYLIISLNPIVNAFKEITGIACSAKDITDDTNNLLALQDAKTELENIMVASLDLICVVDVDDNFINISAASETVLGYKPDELIGTPLLNLVHPDDREKTLQTAGNIMSGYASTNFENRYIKKDGSIVYLEWSAKSSKNHNVRYGVARDITLKKQQENLLIESQRVYKNLFDNNPSPMFIWDFETLNIIESNVEAELLYGYTKEEFFQLTIKDVRPPEDIALIEAATVSEEVYGTIHKQSWRHKKKNGEIFYVDISAHLIDYKGRKSSLVQVTDVTEKLKIEDEIKTSEAKYRSLVESSLDGILLTVKNGMVISANASACKIFQMTEEEICNGGREALVDMTDPRLPILLKERELTGKAKGELTFKRKDGSTFIGEITSVVFKDINGEEKSSMTIRDITDIKKVTAQKDNLLNLLEKSLNEIYIFNKDTLLFEYVNDQALRNIGYATDELLKMTPLSIKPEFNEVAFKNLLQPLLQKKKEKIVFETKHQRANGSLYPVEVHLQLVINSNKSVFLAVILDITERKIIEQQLIDNENKLASIYNNITDAVFMLGVEDNENFKFITVNKSFCNLTGLNAGDVIGAYTHNLIPATSWDFVKANYQKAIATKQNITWEEVSMYPTGEKTGIVTITPLFDNLGKCYSLVGSVHDITDNKKAEEALKISEEKYRVLFHLSPLPRLVHDLNTLEILDINEAAINKYGYSKNEFLGKSIIELSPDTETQQLCNAYDEIKNEQNSNFLGLFTHCKKDGTTIQVEMSGNKIVYQNVSCVMSVCVDVTEREIALKALRDRELKLQIAQEIAKLGSWQLNLLTQELSWSDQAYNIWDIPKHIQPNFNIFYSTIHIEDRERFMIAQNAVLNDERDLDIEHRIVLPNGNIKWVHEKGKLDKDANGNVLSLSGTTQDITPQKLLSNSIEESNQRYEYVTKATSDAIWDWDLTTDKIIWGLGFETIFGYNLKTIKADISFRLDHIHPDDVEAVMAGLYYVIYGTETNWEDEYRFRKSDDTYAYVANKGFVIRDENGKAIRMVGAKRDITQKREEELRLKLLESVITNTNDSVLITEAEPFNFPGPKIVYVNEAFTNMTGYTADEIIGKTPRILQGPKRDRKELDRLKQCLLAFKPCNVTLINYRKNGEEFWINISISPVADKNGWFTHWIAIQRDITDKKLEEQTITKTIIRAQEDERYEIGGELHDNVCQILATGKICFKMIEKSLPEPQVGMFNEGIEHLNLAFKEIRNLSHRLAPVFLNESSLEEEFSRLLKTFDIEHKYQIALHFDNAFKEYPASQEFQLNLYRILQEQLSNIFKYSEATTIKVEGQIKKNVLQLYIEDNGVGFNSNNANTGIGLANIKRRAELFGGKLTIQSSLGKGCKIEVEIPLKNIEQQL